MKRGFSWRRPLAVALELFPLTMRGCLTLLVCVGALRLFGYGRLDLVVFALAICALAILVFCLFCVTVSGLMTQHRIHLSLKARPGGGGSIGSGSGAVRLEAEFPNESGFHTPAMGLFPLARLSWQVTCPDFTRTRLRTGPGGRQSEELIPERRCRTNGITRRFMVSDVLGLCRFTWYRREPTPCIVLPRSNTLYKLPVLRSLTADDGVPDQSGGPQGDRMEIRPYVPGDSVRDILWKVYARNRQLSVRLAERSVFHDDRTLAYLLASPNDEAAAAAARMALESGALGEDWRFGADGSLEPCSTLPAALEAVAASRLPGAACDDGPPGSLGLGGLFGLGAGGFLGIRAGRSPTHPYGLDEFLENVNKGGGAVSHCLLFAAADGGDIWLERLKNTLAGNPNRYFSLILATDGFEEKTRAGLSRRLLLRPDNAAAMTDAITRESMLALMSGLLTETGRIVKSALVVDRRTGACFDHSLRRLV